MAIRIYFLHRHLRYTMFILEEGNLPIPWCPCCDIQVPWADLNGHHTTTVQCAKGGDHKRRRLVAEDIWASMERSFQAYERPLKSVTFFKSLGWILTTLDDD